MGNVISSMGNAISSMAGYDVGYLWILKDITWI
jgi:hypothetical protein